MAPKLVEPNIRYKKSYIEAIREWQSSDNPYGYEKEDIGKLENDFATHIKTLTDQAKGIGLPEGWVPASTYWLVDGDKYIGRISVRHRLTEQLRKFAGHIGYDIRPSERRKDYGKLMLALLIPILRELATKGVLKTEKDKVLITCSDRNLGSIKIIESQGGKLSDSLPRGIDPSDNEMTLRYWMDIYKASKSNMKQIL